MNIYAIDPAGRYDDLIDAMLEDGHGVPNPTHIVESGNQLIGAFSLAYAPVLFFWMSTTRADRLTSHRAFCAAQDILKDMGHSKPILLIQESSPFYPYIERLGFGFIGKGEVFIKG